jgi:glycosyltransferase involved in cell wall biosynthesis
MDTLGAKAGSDAPEAPLISVVIPYYNRRHHIDACVASVLGQSVAPAEVIVVDDGSRAEERRHLDRFGAPVRVVDLGRNQGVSAARNAGLAAARSDWIAFQDSDDVWEPDKLAAQWAHLAANPDCDGVHTAVRAFYGGGKEIISDPLPARLALEDALLHNVIRVQTLLARTSVLRAIGGFDPSLRVCEDDDLGIRLALAGARIDYLPAPLVRLRREGHGHLYGDWRAVIRGKTLVALRHRAVLERVLGPGATRRRIGLAMRKAGRRRGGPIGRLLLAGGWVLGGFDARGD